MGGRGGLGRREGGGRGKGRGRRGRRGEAVSNPGNQIWVARENIGWRKRNGWREKILYFWAAVGGRGMKREEEEGSRKRKEKGGRGRERKEVGGGGGWPRSRESECDTITHTWGSLLYGECTLK